MKTYQEGVEDAAKLVESIAETHRRAFVALEADNRGMAELQRIRQEEAREIAGTIRTKLLKT
jgi:hypothetical protein